MIMTALRQCACSLNPPYRSDRNMTLIVNETRTGAEDRPAPSLL